MLIEKLEFAKEVSMSKLIRQCRVLLCVVLVCLVSGFYICTIGPNAVLFGIAVIGIGMIFALLALVTALKIVWLRNEGKKNSIPITK